MRKEIERKESKRKQHRKNESGEKVRGKWNDFFSCLLRMKVKRKWEVRNIYINIK